MTERCSGTSRQPLQRAIWIYFAAVAFAATGYIAAFTVGTIAVFVITGSRGLSGLPSTAGTLGTAVAAALLSAIMARRGRRAGLVAGLTVAVAGSAVAIIALVVVTERAIAVALLLVAFVGVGFGNASAQLSRYAAADLVPSTERGRAVGVVVWAATIGAVIGPSLPNLVAPTSGRPGITDLVAGFGVVALAMLGALLVLAALLRREPTAAPDTSPVSADSSTGGARLADALRLPQVRVGLLALIAAGITMVAIMTMTPVHLVEHGHGLATVGFVLSAHTLGMFAFSPVAGRLADRYGSIPIILLGFVIMSVSGVLAAIAPADGGPVLTVALFLLGLGWSLNFVAGSSLMTRDVPGTVRIRLQGVTDAVIWTSAAATSALAGVVLQLTEYQLLAAIGAVLAVVPIALIVAESRAGSLEPSRQERRGLP